MNPIALSVLVLIIAMISIQSGAAVAKRAIPSSRSSRYIGAAPRHGGIDAVGAMAAVAWTDGAP